MAERRIAERATAGASARGGTPGPRRRPAFYAARSGSPGRDWWTLLHPPYTAWHLAYVVIGASLAPRPSVRDLVATLLAFFLAVGVAAHALDELRGRPLRTEIPSAALGAVAGVSLAGAVVLGIAGVAHVGLVLVPFVIIGVLLVVGYNLELFGGRLHSDVVFALAWGSFPVLVGYLAQTSTIRLPAVFAACAAFALSFAQRVLSTPARRIRRSPVHVEGTMRLADGLAEPIDADYLLLPLERALRWLSVAVVATAVALAVSSLS